MKQEASRKAECSRTAAGNGVRKNSQTNKQAALEEAWHVSAAAPHENLVHGPIKRMLSRQIPVNLHYVQRKRRITTLHFHCTFA